MRWPLYDIPFFGKKSPRTLVISAEANDLVAVCNAVRHMEIRRGSTDEIIKSGKNIIIQISNSGNSDSDSGLFLKLYAPTTTGYTRGQWVKVTEDSDMAVTGIVCAGSVLQKATPGKFVCLKSTPILNDDGADDTRHIPQLPMPGGTDPDNEDNFWEWISPSSVCIDGVLIEV
jgi:hypothetical protein